MMNYREVPRPHPEMFDQQGNLILDEVIAFNFENYDYDNEEEKTTKTKAASLDLPNNPFAFEVLDLFLNREVKQKKLRCLRSMSIFL